MQQSTSAAALVHYLPDPKVDRRLRQWDVALAVLCLLLLGLPMALACALGKLRREPQALGHGRTLMRWTLHLPSHAVGRFLGALGARHWPVAWHVLRGELSWVGPLTLATLPSAVSQTGLRPGVISLWWVRSRTAVAFQTEADCDAEYLGRRGVKHDIGLLVRGLMLALLPAPMPAEPGRVRICDVAFDNLSMAEAIARLRDMLDGDTTQQASFVNPACVNIAAADAGYRRALNRASLVLPDGIGTKIASDILGTPLKQNVNGTDLFPRLCDLLAARQSRLFLLGGQPGVPDQVARTIQARWPAIRIVGARDGFFTLADEGEVVAEVRASGADFLLVARGVPMQDVFIDRYLPMFGVKVAMGVGGLFDFVSGRIERAPTWMRDSGLEWVYRLMQEPGRMWQRYLVGNFTFLGRVAGQRLGWRQGAADIASAAADRPAIAVSAAAAASSKVRAVVFATAGAAADLPVDADMPAALLPLGYASFAERTMELLSQAGVSDVDLVVSHQPEALRALLAQGQRWGLRLHWHLARDAERPYEAIRALDLRQVRHLVLGHADCWIGAAAMLKLANGQHRLVLDPAHPADGQAPPPRATWASLSAAQLAALAVDGTAADLYGALATAGLPALRLPSGDVAQACSAAALMQAQQLVAGDAANMALPSAWVRTPWGGMHPSARVHAGATVQAPALIGPGCWVAEGATVGPHAVLVRDVVVTRGTLVRDALVLAETYAGGGLDLTQTIVNGGRVAHLALGVQLVLPRSDGLAMSLHAANQRRSAWLPRCTAGLVMAVLSPVVMVDALWRAARGRPARWAFSPTVVGQDEPTGEWVTAPLRVPTQRDARGLARVLSAWGPLRDVAAGRRCWFGARPRTVAEWSALSMDWQVLLVDAPVGLLHAPAWADTPEVALEAAAAADAFQAVSPSLMAHLRILRASLWPAEGPRQRAVVMHKPVWHPMAPAREPAPEAPQTPAPRPSQSDSATAPLIAQL